MQKGESQNGCFKKTKHAQFSDKWTFLTPWYAHVRKKTENLVRFVFLKQWNDEKEFSFSIYWQTLSSL